MKRNENKLRKHKNATLCIETVVVVVVVVYTHCVVNEVGKTSRSIATCIVYNVVALPMYLSQFNGSVWNVYCEHKRVCLSSIVRTSTHNSTRADSVCLRRALLRIASHFHVLSHKNCRIHKLEKRIALRSPPSAICTFAVCCLWAAHFSRGVWQVRGPFIFEVQSGESVPREEFCWSSNFQFALIKNKKNFSNLKREGKREWGEEAEAEVHPPVEDWTVTHNCLQSKANDTLTFHENAVDEWMELELIEEGNKIVRSRALKYIPLNHSVCCLILICAWCR